MLYSYPRYVNVIVMDWTLEFKVSGILHFTNNLFINNINILKLC